MKKTAKWLQENPLVIVLIGVLLILTTFLFIVKIRQWLKLKEINDRMKGIERDYTIDDAAAGLKVVAAKWGKAVAAKVEQLARLETANFTSSQYRKTGTGGMESHGEFPYYGWGDYTWQKTFWLANPTYTPIGTTDMLEGAGLSKEGGNAQHTKPVTFVIMPSVEAWMMFIALFAQVEKSLGGIYSWYSTDPALQQKYAASVDAQATTLTDQINLA